MKIVLLAVFWGLSLLAGPILALAAIPPRDGQPVLVVAWPWGPDPEAIIARAGGYPAAPDRGWLATMAASEAADFPDRLSRAGAALVLDGTQIAGICGDPGET